jgi:inositol phosphorylceramide mannosyltransferase catalytic subunit
MSERNIPRIIHQIYIGQSLPPELTRIVERLKSLNPNWEHRLCDDESATRFIEKEYGTEVLRAYQRIDPRYGAARADLLRLLLLYRFGGVYCDVKSTFERPLDSVIRDDDRYLLCQWRNGPGEVCDGWGLHRELAHIPGGEFVNYFIICEAGHPFTAAAIERTLQNIRSYRPWEPGGWIGVLRTTGPIAYTLGIWPILQRYPHRFVTEEEVGVRYVAPGYGHLKVNHYSQQTAPVVKLSAGGMLVRRCFIFLLSALGK